MKRLVVVTCVVGSILFLANTAVAAEFRNPLPQKSWAQYGVNPWLLDTDNDGYADDWEVKQGFCPTNPTAVHIGTPECVKGIFDLKKGTYIPSSSGRSLLPPEIKQAGNCAELDRVVRNMVDYSDQQRYYEDNFVPSSTVWIEGNILARVERGVKTRVVLYDIRNRTRPRLLRTVEVEGVFAAAKIVNNYLYLFTFRPVATVVSNNQTISSCRQVSYVSPLSSGAGAHGFTTITTVSLLNGKMSQQSFLGIDVGGGQLVHFSGSSAYVVGRQFAAATEKEFTLATRFDFSGPLVRVGAVQQLPGLLMSSGAVVVTEQNIFVATNEQKIINRYGTKDIRNWFFVLDKDLTKRGWNQGFAPGDLPLALKKSGNIVVVRLDHAGERWLPFDVASPFNPTPRGLVVLAHNSTMLSELWSPDYLVTAHDIIVTSSALQTPAALEFYGLRESERTRLWNKELSDAEIYLRAEVPFLFSPTKKIILLPMESFSASSTVGVFSGYVVYGSSPVSGFVFKGKVGQRVAGGYLPVTDYHAVIGGEMLYLVSNNKLSVYRLDNLSVVSEALLPKK